MSYPVMIFDGNNRFRIEIEYQPKRVQIGERLFERVVDPETGKPLGCYVAADRIPRAS